MKNTDQLQRLEHNVDEKATVMNDGCFGTCSACGIHEGRSPYPYMVKVGKTEFGACFEHHIFWEIGSNNVSLHWHMTLNEMRRTASKMDGFRLVGFDLDPGADEVVAWPAAKAVEVIERWFDGFFKAALEKNPALTREQLENMTIDEMLPDTPSVPSQDVIPADGDDVEF